MPMCATVEPLKTMGAGMVKQAVHMDLLLQVTVLFLTAAKMTSNILLTLPRVDGLLLPQHLEFALSAVFDFKTLFMIFYWHGVIFLIITPVSKQPLRLTRQAQG